jgi:hypothetical protein
VLSALTFNFIFQIFDYAITQLDGYYYLGLVLASSLLLTRIPINVTLKTFYIRIAVLVLILIGLFFYVLYVNQTIILLMTLLFIFKFIPFVVSYHISVIHCVPLEYSIYYVYFLPCIFIINKISKYTGSHTTITIHDIPGVDIL